MYDGVAAVYKRVLLRRNRAVTQRVLTHQARVALRMQTLNTLSLSTEHSYFRAGLILHASLGKIQCTPVCADSVAVCVAPRCHYLCSLLGLPAQM